MPQPMTLFLDLYFCGGLGDDLLSFLPVVREEEDGYSFAGDGV